MLTDEQIDCIARHTALVRITQKTSVLLTSIEALLSYGDVEAINIVIGSYFEHVIDLQHPNQDE